jgi:putative ABC transport system permease protein
MFETLKLAASALWAHKLRTSLTLLGVMIGVASVISIISVLEGMMTRISSIFDQMGASTVIVTRFGIITSDDEWHKAMKRARITVADARAIEQGCPLAEEVGIDVQRGMKVKYENKSLYYVTIDGLSANATRINNIDVEEGRFFSSLDDQHRRTVAVIGQEIKAKFFPYDDALGKEIIISGKKFVVIGVGKKLGSILGENLDRYCYIPANTMLKLTGQHNNIDIMVKVRSEALMDQAMDQIRVVMRARRNVAYHSPDDFGLITKDAAMSFVNSFTKNARVIAMGIPFVSIVVAGIVVMNIMMVSVTERTREIGIRKAIGARRKDILSQFLLEAVIMSMLGGLLGLVLGLYVSSIAAGQLGVPFVISVFAVTLGLSIPACIGIFFGIYPAMKASKLDPIEALRFEV